mmetsp:Transcript_6998/g.9380  ORF Transcript_6998/g.9380 Transcript_6998/m.9380 type:complete len:214 (+) Transcript_6998:22-663(+)
MSLKGSIKVNVVSEDPKPRSVSMPMPSRGVVRSSSIMSARTLEESLKGASARQRRRDLSVSFSAVEIREFEIQIGDNPSVSSGPPLTIAWDHFNEAKVDIDTYEANCPQRRDRNQILLPYKERWRRLAEEANMTEDEIFEETKKVNVARRKRAETISNLDGAQWEERLEKAQRWLQNIRNRKAKQDEQRMIRMSIEMDRMERENVRLAISPCQ